MGRQRQSTERWYVVMLVVHRLPLLPHHAQQLLLRWAGQVTGGRQEAGATSCSAAELALAACLMRGLGPEASLPEETVNGLSAWLAS